MPQVISDRITVSTPDTELFAHEWALIERFRGLPILQRIREAAAAPDASAASVFEFAWALEPFVVAFHHYNATFLPSAFGGSSKLHQAIRGHAAEDSKHLNWYYRDLRHLGQGRRPHRMDCAAARVVPGIQKCLAEMTARGCALACLAAIEAVEETGAVFFKACADASNAIASGMTYFGQVHLDSETGSLLGQHAGYGLAELISESSPTPTDLQLAKQAMERVFQLFTDMLNDLETQPPPETAGLVSAGARA